MGFQCFQKQVLGDFGDDGFSQSFQQDKLDFSADILLVHAHQVNPAF